MSETLYFGEEVNNAIIKYQQSQDIKEKNMLCEKIIIPAFTKLSSYWFRKLPIRKNEDVIHDCVVDLFEKIHMFDASKNSKAFSYFNIIAKHFFYQKMKNEKKEATIEQDLISLNDSASINNESLLDDEFEDRIEKVEFLEIFKENLPIWKDKFKKPQEVQIIEALCILFENAENIDIYNKKAIFFYLKEITGMNSKQIAVNLNKIKTKFSRLKSKYNSGDV